MKPRSSLPHQDPSGHPAHDQTDLPALGWMRRARAEEELLAEISRKVSGRRRTRLGLISGVLALVVVGSLVWNSLPRRDAETDLASSLTAKVSVPERRILPDSSVIELKDGAQVDVDYSGVFRRVTLRQGEALFEVAKNEAWPFIVEAAGVKVRAVGTAFTVQLAPEERVEVLVTEGRVQVAPLAKSLAGAPEVSPADTRSAAEAAGFTASQPIMHAGYRATINLDRTAPQIVAVSESEMADRLSWRVPSLEFSRTPLTEVVALMNQHSAGGHKVRFVIADDELSKIRLTGFLRTNNSEGLVRLLENNFGVETERADDQIVLRKKR